MMEKKLCRQLGLARCADDYHLRWRGKHIDENRCSAADS
jgi:hypothetical protein